MLANLFGKKSKSLLGVDISSTSVKVLELSRNDDRYRVEAYASEPLPPNAVVEQGINNDEEVGEAIRRAIAKSRSSAKLAALAVAGSSVITKTIQMSSSLSDNEMETQIRLDADQYIPYPLDEVALDWERLESPANNKEVVMVLLAACRTETVERRKDVVEYADLQATVIDIEAFCTERAFSLIKEQLDGDNVQTVGVLDIGATMTTLNVIHKGASIYTREQLFGGRQLVEDIMRRYGLNEDEAALARNGDGLPDDYEPEVLEPFRAAVVQQASRSLQFFYSSSQFNDIDYLILAGGTALLPGLEDKIRTELGLSVMVANPFRHMTLAKNVNAAALHADAPSLMVACGLAMRGFD